MTLNLIFLVGCSIGIIYASIEKDRVIKMAKQYQ